MLQHLMRMHDIKRLIVKVQLIDISLMECNVFDFRRLGEGGAGGGDGGGEVDSGYVPVRDEVGEGEGYGSGTASYVEDFVGGEDVGNKVGCGVLGCAVGVGGED